MKIEFDLLANRKQYLPQLAQWYFDEWGELTQAASVYVVERRLHEYLNSDKIPLILLAIQAGELAGAVQLKFREMTIYPDREHWIGGVYVAEKFRGKKLATTLVDRAIVLAQQMGAQALYLQTKRLDGGLYRKMGWRVTETVVYRGIAVAVMVKKIGAIHD